MLIYLRGFQVCKLGMIFDSYLINGLTIYAYSPRAIFFYVKVVLDKHMDK